MYSNPSNRPPTAGEQPLSRAANVLGSQSLAPAADALNEGAMDYEPEVLGSSDGTRSFRVGDRVRVAKAGGEPELIGRSGIIERVSVTDSTKFSVRFDDERQLIRFPSADFQFDIEREVKAFFPELVGRHSGLAFLKSDQVSLDVLTGAQWAEMRIDVPPYYVKKEWAKSGGIPLRYTKDPAVKIMVIGCGNTPTPERRQELDFDGGHPAHGSDTYTVDPEIDLGPTLIGLFGNDPVHRAFLPGNFTAIQFEGYTPLPDRAALEEQPFFVEALDHLLADGGVARFSVGKNSDPRTIWAQKKNGRLTTIAPSYGEWADQELTPGWLLARLDELKQGN
ncbi:MAG: hypothetical protein JWN52_2176 [Actinomycetia bacterium]|nr:hypothetical protein [Actinomycetes bacterium]